MTSMTVKVKLHIIKIMHLYVIFINCNLKNKSELIWPSMTFEVKLHLLYFQIWSLPYMTLEVKLYLWKMCVFIMLSFMQNLRLHYVSIYIYIFFTYQNRSINEFARKDIFLISRGDGRKDFFYWDIDRT